ncbi:MAG TPA: anthranilate phosphoribosyltransferase [Gemmatales bacterium]|nr:anthranilate phosphoribosyltransferase [Gemmatales bacterium]
MMFESTLLQLLDGKLREEESLSFLASQCNQQWSGEQLAYAATLLRERMQRIVVEKPLLDTCGTGGDHQSTINLSTAASLVLAAGGITVAKHGNRAVSSTSGSSDVLQRLGLPVDVDGEQVKKLLESCGWAFCVAPRFHPRLSALAPLRKRLGIPTIFNYLGPLCNPCLVNYQVLGVGRYELLQPMAEALVKLGIERAVVVHGEPGIDEVSLQGITHVRLVESQNITQYTWVPEDFALPVSSIESIRCADAANSTEHLLQIFKGTTMPGTPWVLANAAVGFWLTTRAKTLRDGVQQAREVVGSGKVEETLQKLQEACCLEG